jgi:hypothetical protein
MSIIPRYLQRIGAPRPAQLARAVTPEPLQSPRAAIEGLGNAVAQQLERVDQERERALYMAAETNISQQTSHQAERLRELERMPSGEVDSAADKLLSDARSAWGSVRSNAGRDNRVRHTVDLMVDNHERELAERVDQIRGAARGGMIAEKLDKSLSDRARTVEADPDSFSRTDAEVSFNIDHALVSQRAQAAMRERARSTLSLAALRGAIARDAAGTAEQLRSENPTAEYIRALDPKTRADALAIAEKQARDNQVASLTDRIARGYRDGDVFKGNRLLQSLDESTLPEDVKDTVRSEVRARNELWRVEVRQKHSQEIVGVQRALAADRANARTERTLHRLYSIGAYSTDEYAGALAQMDAGALRRARSDAGAGEIAKALSEGLPLDPKDADHRKALANAFDTMTNNGAPRGSGPWRSTALAVAKQTRMLPEQAVSWTRSAMRSPNVDIASTAAQFLGAVQLDTPDAVSEIDTDTRAFAGVVNSMIENGTSPKEAVETARANVFEVRPETREARQRAWGGAGTASLVNGTESALNRYIDRDFDAGMFSAEPAVSDPRAARIPGSVELSVAFREQTGRYFLKTGDISLARDHAWQDVKRVFGVSQVNGSPALMALPPERFGVTPEEVRTELGNFLKGNPQADGSTAADIVLVPDSATLRQLGDAISGEAIRPGWRLVTKSGDLVLDRNGIPKRYTIPGGEEISRRIREAEASAEARAREQVEAAKKHREVIRGLRDDWLIGGAM